MASSDLPRLSWIPFFRKFDSSFVTLAIASGEEIFLCTFVLIRQNRMQALADERADLNLHISLLAEPEITWLIQFTMAMATEMCIEDAQTSELNELAQDVLPEQIIEEMQRNSELFGTSRGGSNP